MAEYMDMNALLELDMKHHIDREIEPHDYSMAEIDATPEEHIDPDKEEHNRTCVVCGVKFPGHHGNQRFCSPYCCNRRSSYMDYNGQYLKKAEVAYIMYRQQKALSGIAKALGYKNESSVKKILKRNYNITI